MIKKYSRSQVRRDLPKRTSADNKTRGGKSLIIAGSKGMWGAALLSATAASRSGSGYVFIFNNKIPAVFLKAPDFLIESSKRDFEIYNAIAIGPGMSGSANIRTLLSRLWPCSRVVVDASALDVIAKIKKKIPATWILTPHEGELARMLGVPSSRIKADRIQSVLAAQKKWGCIILLKGHRTLVAGPEGVMEISAGNAALAKAGTGDVLTGMITGFLSQGVEPMKAACLAACVHGVMAEEWVNSGQDHLSLMASDLLALLPQSLKKLRY